VNAIDIDPDNLAIRRLEQGVLDRDILLFVELGGIVAEHLDGNRGFAMSTDVDERARLKPDLPGCPGITAAHRPMVFVSGHRAEAYAGRE
jgi:hypothetical protein